MVSVFVVSYELQVTNSKLKTQSKNR